MEQAKLISLALEARQRAYAPYSRYLVGAALLTASGQVYTGCNVENASYGLTVCAERVAVFKAISVGERDFSLIVVATENGATPCGACRQVLLEFSPKLEVITVDAEGRVHHRCRLNDLLPEGFTPEDLSREGAEKS